MERVLIKEEQKRNMLKKSKRILDNKMFVAQCPHMMNQSALRMKLPAVSLYVVHVLFESKVGTLADQLNILCFSACQHHIRFIFEQLSLEL